MLPLRPASDAGVFNHSAETTIAARGGTVVVAYISMAFEQAGSFQTATVIRGGTIAVSHDRGDTFGAAIPMAGDQPTDPVVRVSQDGTFFASSWDWTTATTTSTGSLQASRDGELWQTVAGDIPTGDKQWFGIDDVGGRIFWGGLSGFRLFGFDGSAQGSGDTGAAQMTNAMISGGAALFVTLDYRLARWDGSAAAQVRLLPLPGLPGPDLNTTASTGLGATPDGRVWLLRTVVDAGVPRVAMRVWDGSVDGDGEDVDLSRAGAYAFLPAGAVDGAGRVHAIWYEDGALVWTHSRSSSLGDGFVPTTVIDGSACPAGGWVPTFDTLSGGRRLREYIDLAVDGPRVHIAWTHAPAAPSRVYTVTIRM